MRTVSFSERSASRPAGRPEHAHDAEHDGDGTNGGASHSGGGITNASHPHAQHGGGMRVHHSLAQRTQRRESSASEPRRDVQPFLRACPPHPARDGGARGVAPSTVRHNDQLQASRYDDAGFVTLGRPPPSAIRSRSASDSDPAGGGDDSTVAAPRSSAPPALTDAGRDDGNSTVGGASHGGSGVTNASHPRAQRGGDMRVHYSLAQRTQPPSAIRSRRTSASDPAGGGSDSTVAAPRSPAPPALTAGGAAPDTHDVHNATPRATPLGTSRTHTTRLPV